MSSNCIELFSDVGLTEDEINKKYPEKSTSSNMIYDWIREHPIIVSVSFIILLIIIFDLNSFTTKVSKFKQSGGAPENGINSMNAVGLGGEGGVKDTMRKVASPVSTSFGLVTTALGKFMKLLLLLVMIVLVPTIPILLYCLVAYYVIKKFLQMFTRIK